HWPATSRPDSVQTADGGKDWMQRAQSDDEFRHAGLHSSPLTLDQVGRCRRQPIHAPKRSTRASPRSEFLLLLRDRTSKVGCARVHSWPSHAYRIWNVMTDIRNAQPAGV